MENTFNHKLYTFDSGLRLVVIPMESTKTATVLVMVSTGSKYETKEINGISHFLEHMMFKGTEKRPNKLDISRELDGIGAEYNAFTGKEYTGYYAKASVKKIDTVMDVVFDIFLNSKLDEKEINTERGVIVEELNMYRDMPQRYVGDLFEKLLYGDQPAGWDIGGEKETVMNLKREEFLSYFNNHYIASKTVVAVAGNVDPEEIKSKVEGHFKNIRQGKEFGKPAVIEKQDKPEILLHHKKTDQTHFILGVRAYDKFNDKKYPLGILSTILGGGMSSRLFSEVRDKRGLAYYIGAGGESYTDSGFFMVKAGVNNQKTDEALEVIMEELRKVKREGITSDELQRAKDQIEGSLALGLEHSDAVAETYAESLVFHNKILTPEGELDKMKKVTLEQVLEVASEIFDGKKLNLSLIGPFKESKDFKEILRF
ncbi:MAG: insulinase family protein [Candidatus Yanofskybacteria bacterium]|nr:insulinase family protein [Candidatus Yanofskybacteria bacterium]